MDYFLEILKKNKYRLKIANYCERLEILSKRKKNKKFEDNFFGLHLSKSIN